MTPDEVLDTLAADCRDDHVGLWQIVNAARHDLGARNSDETRAAALRLVRSLLGERGVRVGHPTQDGRRFAAWELAPGQAVRRIYEEWSAPGREPDIGEVTWFTDIRNEP
jgi:hypothetical protein